MILTNAILSWHSTLTLVNTLESYRYYGLDELASQKTIFFQEITGRDIKIAKEYGYDYIGDPNNIGIAAAYKQLVDHTTSDLFLFLENDWELLRDPLMTMNDAIGLLDTGWIDVAKLRSRFSPGEPLWSRQYTGKEREHPTFMLDAVHWRQDWEMLELRPEIQMYHSNISEEAWFLTDAKHANWTNNPTMFRTDWLRETILPRLSGDIEKALQPWWEQQEDIRVAQGLGLFTHRRLDR
jgi:hypothetical protein